MNENTQSELHERLASLKKEHRQLDEEITGLEHSAAGNQLQITRLKKRKLQLRDEITKIEDGLLPDIIA